MTSKENISKVKRIRKVSTSSVEAYSFVPKLFKSEHMSLVKKECAYTIVAESDEGEPYKVIVQEDVEKEERLVASLKSYGENFLEVDSTLR